MSSRFSSLFGCTRRILLETGNAGKFDRGPRFPCLTPNPTSIKNSPMTNISNLSTTQLRQVLTIKEQIEALQSQIDSIAAEGGEGEAPSPSAIEAPKKHRRSAATRARMAAAQQARWAKIKGTDATDSKPAKKKRRLSAAGRAAIAAAAKARWARVRAERNTTL